MSNKFKIGVIADMFRQSIEECIESSAKVGAEGVQLYASFGRLSPENITADTLASVKNTLKANGLSVSAVCGDLGGHGFAVREENPRKVELSKRIVDLTLELGSNIITTHVGTIPADKNEERFKIMQEACNELAEYANKNGAFFAIETGPEKADTLKMFLDSLDTKGIAVNLDPANFVMVTKEDPVYAVHTLKDYIVHTHAKDGIMLKQTEPKIIYDFFAEGGIGDLRLDEYFKEVPLGQGQVDFDAYIKALSDIGYNGYLTVEREVGDNPYGDIEMAVKFLKKYI
ncbi:MAG: sugar phosphate isomerase/epimerase [Ruminococcaceae bacterium]|nr:sugar phosphate isomerase/epimerase [Oscillospiraceae bacterium]